MADNGANNLANGVQVPQHPDVPQHLLDLDLSSSSMRFLRANGPDIKIHEVWQLSDDSSSSSDASSNMTEERARFIAARSHCAAISLFHRKNLPGGSNNGPLTVTMKPIFIDNTLLSDQNASKKKEDSFKPTGWEIVPWHLAPAVVLLQAFPYLIKARCKAMTMAKEATSMPLPVSSPIIISEQGVVHGSGLVDSGPVDFEIQMEDLRPSPVDDMG